MDSKHTPGPWVMLMESTFSTAWPAVFPVVNGEVDEYGDSVAELASSHIQKSRRGAGTYAEKPDRFKLSRNGAEVLANARLIAAAPDLLLELRLLVEAIEGHSAPEGSAADEPYIASRLTFAHDAIDKATKEQP